MKLKKGKQMSVNQGESSDDSYEIDEDIEQQLNRWWREANDLENDYWYRQKQLQGKNTRNKQGKEKLLEKYCLPQCNSFREISKLINVDLADLRLLVFSPKQDAATKHHYICFSIPKKTGGERIISAPTQNLKNVQYWILKNVLKKLEPSLHDAAHGFRNSEIIKEKHKINIKFFITQVLNTKYISIFYKFRLILKLIIYAIALPELIQYPKFGKRRSIVTNAEPHVGADVIINVDIKDFFHSISYRRVKGLFRSFGYSESASTIFALLCTVTFVNHRSYLPQGAPTSPMITNLICRRLDRRLTQMTERFGFRYTRYADDLTFSASNESVCNIGKVLRHTEGIVKHEGFEINRDKTRIMRKSNRLEVTGIVVNSKPSISREKLKRFRATLYQIEKDGLEGKFWGNSTDVMSSIQGFANFVYMVDPQKGAKFRDQIGIIKEKYKC
ncbi:reverse transcriptase family protein [Nostoc sp.]|uniref:reverse transcriptase family protein n=1 Tax=Nostoc sp. TaxID=1180 RepID=UPI002FFBDA04